MINNIRLLLAGKAIEELNNNQYSTIEANLNFKKASNILLENSILFELTKENYNNNEYDNFIYCNDFYNSSDFYKIKIEKSTQIFLKKLIEENKMLIQNNFKTIEKIKNYLLENEKIDKKTLNQII